MSFCEQNALVIANTLFQHRRKVTWISPNGKVKNTIDYALVRKSKLNNVCDAAVLGHPDISDHKPLRLKIKLDCWAKKAPDEKRFRFNFQRLKNNEELKQQYEREITEKLQNQNSDSNPDILYQNIQETLIEVSQSCLGRKKVDPSKNWRITDETVESIQLKKEIRRNLGSDSLLYKLHRNNVKRLCRNDIERSIDQ